MAVSVQEQVQSKAQLDGLNPPKVLLHSLEEQKP
jgi:hypothetical protein